MPWGQKQIHFTFGQIWWKHEQILTIEKCMQAFEGEFGGQAYAHDWTLFGDM